MDHYFIDGQTPVVATVFAQYSIEFRGKTLRICRDFVTTNKVEK